MASEINIAIGKNISMLRKAQGMTQQDLADQLGVSKAYIGAVETGTKNISMRRVHEFASLLGCYVDISFTPVSPIPIQED